MRAFAPVANDLSKIDDEGGCKRDANTRPWAGGDERETSEEERGEEAVTVDVVREVGRCAR